MHILTFAHFADVVAFIFADSHDSGGWSNKGWRLSDDEKIIAACLVFFCSLFWTQLHNHPLKPEVKQAEQKGEVEAF